MADAAVAPRGASTVLDVTNSAASEMSTRAPDPTPSGHTRRTFLAVLGATGAALGAAASAPWKLLVPGARGAGVLSDKQLRTLRAAVARIVPAQGSGDWSAADVGADNYIVGLLQGDKIFAGGPVRSRFPIFQKLWRTKRIGWDREVQRLRALYANLDSSVVNGDQRFWGIPNLYTIDGSVFPTAGGYNPTLTIEALAWRAAEGIAKRHGYRR